MTGNKIGFRKAFALHCPERGHGSCQYRRLRILGQLQLFGRPVETQIRKRETECFIRFFKDLSGRRKLVGQIFSHARILRPLAGKNECNHAHFGTHASGVPLS